MALRHLAGWLAALLVWVSIASVEHPGWLAPSDGRAVAGIGTDQLPGSVDDHHLDDQAAQQSQEPQPDPRDGVFQTRVWDRPSTATAFAAPDAGVPEGRAERDPPFRPPRVRSV
jgi:hypothetical protein